MTTESAVPKAGPLHTVQHQGGWSLLGASCVHLAVMLGCWGLFTWVYTSEQAPLDDASLWLATEALLVVGGATAGALTGHGIWLTVVWSRWPVALAKLILVALPSAFMSLVWWYAIAIFRGLL
ncbi:MAG: hypothetical protein AAFX99_14360 [Myxococcota bacterium]